MRVLASKIGLLALLGMALIQADEATRDLPDVPPPPVEESAPCSPQDCHCEDGGECVCEPGECQCCPEPEYSPPPLEVEEPAYTPQVILYSPATWHCQWCDTQQQSFDSASLPFTVEHRKRDGMGSYPQVWFSTPEDEWKRYTGYVAADRIVREWRKYHDCPAASQTAESPGNPEVERTLTLTSLHKMSSGQLRDVIRRWGTPLPRSGTVVGMTVTYHLTNDHGFSASRIAGLSNGERHAVHQIAHNITDGRVTARATARPSAVTTAPPHCPSCASGYFYSKKALRKSRRRNR